MEWPASFARLVLIASVVLAIGCGSERRSPTAPSSAVAANAATANARPDGASGPVPQLLPDGPALPSVIAFPPRNEPNEFFRDLIAFYRDVLRRSPATTFVDPEGQNVWLTEYFRFFLNGCSHLEAMTRTLREITQGGTQPVCGGETPAFPPRDLPYEFQQQLEFTYANVLRRGPTATFVDPEGANVWLSQYLRLRLTGCEHLVAENKVFMEIRGGGVQPDCAPPPPPPPNPTCSYFVSPTQITVTSSGGYVVNVTTNPGDCRWTATSSATWILITSGTSGTGARTIFYNVAQNFSGVARTATITVAGLSGVNPPAIHTVTQLP